MAVEPGTQIRPCLWFVIVLSVGLPGLPEGRYFTSPYLLAWLEASELPALRCSLMTPPPSQPPGCAAVASWCWVMATCCLLAVSAEPKGGSPDFVATVVCFSSRP